MTHPAPVTLSPASDIARGMPHSPRNRPQTATAVLDQEETPTQPEAKAEEPPAKTFIEDEVTPNAGRRGDVTAVFSGYVFRASDNDTIYTQKNGSKSKKLATCMVELNHSGVYVKGSIYAKQGAAEKQARAEFSFFGANNQTCIAIDDPLSKVDLDRWKATVALDFVKWFKQQTTTTTGRVTTGADLDGISI